MNTIRQPLHPFSENPVSGYPLIDGELGLLADCWWDLVYDHSISWTLSGSVDGSEVHERKHALARIELLAQILGEEEITRIRDAVEQRWRKMLGEDQWAAYKAGRVLYQEDAQQNERRHKQRARKHRIRKH
jgi:hypothetical protein